MTRLGIFLLVMGIGTFVLPMVGLEFRLMSLFGEYQPIAAAVAIVVGGVLTFVGLRRSNTQ